MRDLDVEPPNKKMEDFTDTMTELAKIGGIALLIIGMMTTCIYMKKWEYDECLMVGHSPSYCTAQSLGCFSGGNRK